MDIDKELQTRRMEIDQERHAHRLEVDRQLQTRRMEIDLQVRQYDHKEREMEHQRIIREGELNVERLRIQSTNRPPSSVAVTSESASLDPEVVMDEAVPLQTKHHRDHRAAIADRAWALGAQNLRNAVPVLVSMLGLEGLMNAGAAACPPPPRFKVNRNWPAFQALAALDGADQTFILCGG